ncbi:MAG TPA: hypothetical protein VJM11_06075 [Nevskiaceae bacterium]|nr:hypothetical protein [Nevskiaceae bacterium]
MHKWKVGALALAAATVYTGSASAATAINSAFVDRVNHVLVLEGRDLAPAEGGAQIPWVEINGIKLDVLPGYTFESVSATLPENLPDGEYRIFLSRTNEAGTLSPYEVVAGKKDEFEVSVFDLVPGPTGPTGPRGRRGRTGLQGPIGPQGEVGPAGPAGEVGPIGATGATGDVGPTGATGDTGPKGNKGDTGDTGPIGPTGATGDTGAKGNKGDTGAEGPQGVQGDIGPIGPTGPKGNKGDTGDTGAVGATGATGDRGPRGFPGVSGRVTATQASGNNSVSPRTVTATCPEGKLAIGGGAALTGTGATTEKVGLVSDTLSGDNAWTATAAELYKNTPSTWILTVTVVCADINN